MCVVSINVNEAALRDMRPELNTPVAISLWVQQQIDGIIKQMELENTESISIESNNSMSLRAMRRQKALERDLTPEELYAVISEEIDDIYANG